MVSNGISSEAVEAYVVEEDSQVGVMTHEVPQVVERRFVALGLNLDGAKKEARDEAAQNRVEDCRAGLLQDVFSVSLIRFSVLNFSKSYIIGDKNISLLHLKAPSHYLAAFDTALTQPYAACQNMLTAMVSVNEP